MMKLPKKILALTALATLCLPGVSSAATISAASSGALSAGNTSVIDVFLNTDGQLINTVEGSVTVQAKTPVQIKELSVANSALTIWPRKPSLESGKTITFVGGVPGGIKSNQVRLFRIIAKLDQPGDITLDTNSVSAYLNDGKATVLKVTGKSVLAVGPSTGTSVNEWDAIISNDNVPPEPFTITLVQDSNLFNNKKFLSFETTDGQSGIDYYEVREGNYPAVRTGTSYVIIDQSNPPEITVVAYDKAGNSQTSIFQNKKSTQWWVISAVSVALLLSGCAAYLFYRRRFQKTPDNET